MTKRICLIDGCDREANVPGAARGMCRTHYTRVQRYGDPHFVTDHDRKYGTPEERLWRVTERRGPDECWLYKGVIHPNGYGVLSLRYRKVSAHRLSYELHHGEIPPDLMVLHSCDVRNCVNPRHLRVGTAADNMQDCVIRDRVSRKASRPKLTPDLVRQARVRAASGDPLRDIATDLGVQKHTIWHAVTRRTWQNVV